MFAIRLTSAFVFFTVRDIFIITLVNHISDVVYPTILIFKAPCQCRSLQPERSMDFKDPQFCLSHYVDRFINAIIYNEHTFILIVY